MKMENVFKHINFTERYMLICEKYADYNNRMKGNGVYLCETIFNKLGVEFKYLKKDRFFKLEDNINAYKFNLHLDLRNGIVEALLYIENGNHNYKPDGRFDFIPEEIGEKFDREKYNLPKYTNAQELENILKEILSIYEDLKIEFLERLNLKNQ